MLEARAGIAGAIGNNGVDVVGVGWNLSIMPVRYYNTPGGGFLNDLLDGARWAADHGARCVNVSQTGVENAAVQTTGAYVRSRGGLLLYAAGNDGRDLSWFDWPDVIVVGGTDQNDDLLSDSFVTSAHGLAVDVFAPGADMLSTYMNPSGGLGLGIGSGTSSSVAVASGLCGLVWSLQPGFTTEEVEASLFAGCDDLGPLGEDPFWGWGRIHSSGSVLAAMESAPWVDLGFGLPGTSGAPLLLGDGALLGSDPVVLELTAARPSTAAHLCIGLALLNAPFKGGVMVPDTDLIVSGLVTDTNGELTLGSSWPPGIPSGFSTFFQYWIVDDAGPQGFAASNAVSGTTP
ncbi:MAG: S8 family peptidase [Planctomycetota bacterium]